MSTRLIDEIEKIAAEATLESTAQEDTLPPRPVAPPTRPAGLEPLQTWDFHHFILMEPHTQQIRKYALLFG